MLGCTLPSVDSSPLGQHPLVKQLLKGCFNSNSPLPRYSSTWNPDDVLHYIMAVGPNES